MCEVNKCCCCVDLRTGAIVIAILQLIGGAGCFGMGASEWQNIMNGVVGLLAGVCLLVGAINYHQTATLVYLVLDMIAIVLAGVAMAVIIIGGATFTASVSGNPDFQDNQGAQDVVTAFGAIFITIFAIVYGLIALFYIYFWVCVFSFYKGLKSREIISPA